MADQDYGLKVSPEDVDARLASAEDLLLDSTEPLMKLDRTGQNSFRNIGLTFITNTPDGVDTMVARVPHGYTYKPDIWLSVQNSNSGTGVQKYFQDTGQFAFGATIFETAQFSWRADETYVYFYVNRSTVSILGIRLLIRLYVFVDDIGA